MGINESGYIKNCYVTGTVSGTENSNTVGGLIGENISGAVTACHTNIFVKGSNNMGGLVGRNDFGVILACHTKGNLACKNYVGGLIGHNNSGTVRACYSDSTVSGAQNVGGLIGYNYNGNIISCYATGSVSGRHGGGLVGVNWQGKVIRCYSTGKPAGNWAVGGLCGSGNKQGNYEDTRNFWDIQTSEMTASMMGTGLTTAEMKMLSTFSGAGWDFTGETANGTDDIWRMCADGIDYPKLNWEYVRDGDFSCPDGIGFDDLLKFSNDWLSTYSTPLYGADADGDKNVNFADFAVLASHWLENNGQ